jgi:hypothetical protein
MLLKLITDGLHTVVTQIRAITKRGNFSLIILCSQGIAFTHLSKVWLGSKFQQKTGVINICVIRMESGA